VFVERVYLDELKAEMVDEWPFTIPSIRRVAREGLEFFRPVTILVGENGSGKSTLVEAIAEGFKMDARGGRAARKAGNPVPGKTELGEVLRLRTTSKGARMLAGPRQKRKGFFLRADTAFSMAENLGGVHGYWEDDTAKMSHGESYLVMLETMCRTPGFYVFDEPESGLSFASCLRLIDLIVESSRGGAQFVCATHSPLLAAIPGADIIALSADGWERVRWEELELVRSWRRFLGRPDMYLEEVAEP